VPQQNQGIFKETMADFRIGFFATKERNERKDIPSSLLSFAFSAFSRGYISV
jgi:hypothetical protein